MKLNKYFIIIIFIIFVMLKVKVQRIYAEIFYQNNWKSGAGQEIWDIGGVYNSSKYFYDTYCYTNIQNQTILNWIDTVVFPAPTPGGAVASANISAGMLTTDGKYLYIKNWYSTDNNDNKLKMIGTGYNGTTLWEDYGYFSDTPTNRSKSMTFVDVNNQRYFLNGYTTNGSNLQKVNLNTKQMDYYNLPSGLVKKTTGLPFSGADDEIFITASPRYLYNVAHSINNNGNNGFTIKIFDLLNIDTPQIKTIPMANSFADIAGIYVDNNYIYILERANNPEAVRIDLQTNQIVKRWQYANGNFSQNGCYDFENNVLWMSVLGAQPRIYKYTGYSEVSPTYSVIYYTAGILYSSKFFVANSADFTSVSFDSELLSQTNIYLQLRTANSAVEIETEQWRGANGINTFFTGIYTPLLNDYYSNKKYIQYRAILLTADTAITPKLKSVSINYLPKDAEKYTIRITNDGGALKNFNEPIYIAIIDTATNSVVSNYTGIVNITLDGNVNDAVWSLANGNGSLDTSIPGVARYTFSPLDNGVFTLYLKYNNIGTIRFSANSITPQGRYIIEEDSAPLVVSDYIYYEIETFSPYIKNTNFQMRITAKNSFGIDTTYNNTALLNVVLGAGVIAPLSVSINNGSSGIFNAMYNYSDTMRIFAYQINDSSVFGYSDTLYFLNKIANIVLNVETQSYYIAGRDYTATITIYDDSGNIVTNYSGSVILKQSEILYLMPASKYKEIQRAGLETSGDIVISNFINGVAQFGFHYDDAGTIAFRVVDDSAGINSNYSHNLQFTPAYFDITISNIKDTAGIDFDFNVIAKSLNNETMPNYNSILTFSPIFINPDITNAVDTNGLKITNAVITNGSLNVSQRYKESGSIRIKVSDNNYCADTVISSVSDILTFYPEKFQVLIQYPSGRSFFYLTEPWYNVNIFSISYDSEVTNNYNREIEFNKTSLKYPFNLPNNYTFSPQIDNGVLQYSNYLISLDTGINTISLYDKQRSNIKGSATANVQYAKIKIFDAAARAGAAANVRCAVLNEYNNIITADNSTRFKIAIVQPSSATSIAQTHFQNIINGEAYFTVFDNISEKVRVIPLPEYGVPQDTEAGIITFTDLKLKVKDAWLTVNDTAIPQTQLVRIELLNDFYRQEKWLDTAPLYYSIDTSTLSDSIIIINPDIFAISKDNSYDTFYIKVLPGVNYPLTLNLMPISAQATPLSGKIEFLLSKKNIRILQYKK